jgi:hypothetical protein
VAAGIDGPVVLDVDDTIVPVHGYAKQGAGFGYTGIRGQGPGPSWRDPGPATTGRGAIGAAP